MSQPGDTRYPCAVCGDPWTMDAADYVELVVRAPNTDATQWLGAHTSCMNKFLQHVKIEIAGDSPRA